MAIVKMRKLQLVAMSYDKDALLDAMQRTGAVEITFDDNVKDVTVSEDTEGLRGYYARVETAMEALCSAVERKQKENKIKSDVLNNGFDVTYNEFFAIQDQKKSLEEVVEKIHTLLDEKNALSAELAKAIRAKEQARLYSVLNLPFSAYGNTTHTQSRLGSISAQTKENFENALNEQALCAYKLLNTDSDFALYHVTAHKSATAEMNGILSAFGFLEVAFEKEKTGEEVYATICEKEDDLLKQISENEATMYALNEKIHDLKVYCDYLRFTLEKADVSEKILQTERTFLMQA